MSEAKIRWTQDSSGRWYMWDDSLDYVGAIFYTAVYTFDGTWHPLLGNRWWGPGAQAGSLSELMEAAEREWLEFRRAQLILKR